MPVLLAVLMLASLIGASGAAAHAKTTETIFQAFHPDGQPAIYTRSKSGSCFAGSRTINRADAWRCFVGNYIYDPCFNSSQALGVGLPRPRVGGCG